MAALNAFIPEIGEGVADGEADDLTGNTSEDHESSDRVDPLAISLRGEDSEIEAEDRQLGEQDGEVVDEFFGFVKLDPSDDDVWLKRKHVPACSSVRDLPEPTTIWPMQKMYAGIMWYTSQPFTV
ncbi:uncharacterized protein KY384_003588 [Bacidia gigantensis]|uniref:uncharacterized protein n=1 Tax=Bacidia gigantensis TaxID=2732470 RepID=UPI001D04B486|nr:uncharacterized protein KY384_003588 [Bacidia gigantensis]KAG8531952.1 hypothetical protein KY384_003588 [Bacidia gigantensis]